MNLIELHILQSFPVTCLNRDDVGAPKSAVFGGCQRARVSSQSWKRAIREMAKTYDSGLFRGQRTRYVLRALEDGFRKKNKSEIEARVLAEIVAEALGKVDNRDKGNVKTLLYFSPLQLDEVIKSMLSQQIQQWLPVILEDDSEDEKLKKRKEKADKELGKLAAKAAKALGSAVKDAADIAIFGRMVADDHSLMIEGAGLFSHSLSTHPVSNEIDFFSAVDDMQPEDDEGAAHLGTLEFNSACYYRYVGLNLDMLANEHHLSHFTNDERHKVIEAFLRASILAVPPARKNSMFGFNPPGYVLGLRREGQPLSLINAFEAPVRSTAGYLEESWKAMKKHWERLQSAYSFKAEVETTIPSDNLDTFIEKLNPEA